jgi:outer membrane protein assembly factor BamA
VQRGLIAFVDDRRIYPAFDLELNTSASNYDITVGVAGTPGDITTTLTSEPSLPEPDIMAILVTGRTVDDMRGEEFEVAREQVLSYLAGRLGSTLGRGLQRATGLSEVRIEPTLIANETDPSARLTVGQDLTDELKLVYSTNLSDSNDQIWVAEYDVTRRFQTRAVRQGDETYRLDFNHDVRLGGQRAPRRIPRVRPTVMEVVATSATGEPMPEVAERFKVKAGDSYDFFAVRSGIERVESALIDQDYLQSRVRLERDVKDMTARLRLRVTRGPRVELQFVGAMPPEKVIREVRRQWHRGVFDKQRGEDGVEALREWLMSGNHLQARAEYSIEENGSGQRRVVFRIDPGPRYSKVILAFDGASGIDPDLLDRIVDQQELERQLFTDPLVVTGLLQRYYREQGYLVAEIDEPRYEFNGPQARVVLAVREGPRFTVRRISASGNHAYTTEALLAELPIMTGQPYLPASAERALDRIRELYWRLGYNDVRSDHELVIDRAAGAVDVAFTISEGAQTFISDVVVAGNHSISEQLVRGQLELNRGTSLDLSALARSRRNLYDTGAFSVVEITPVRVDFETAAPASSTSGSSENETPAAEQETVRVDVSLREVQPIQLRYGASYDTEGGAGGILDVAYRNFLGGARVAGVRARYDRLLHEARLYINQPAVRVLPFKTTGSIYFIEDLNPPTDLTRAFSASRKGFSVQQETELRNRYVWSWGYRYEHAEVLEPTSTVPVRETLTVSPVTTTFTRETRDEVLDAATGSFISHAFAYSPRFLGSTQPYIKYFGQYFHYLPLQAPKRKPLTNELLRPRLVYAAGVRFGLAHSFGDVTLVPRSERFFAGGSATLRGFAQNTVGPIVDLVPVGGDAIIIINNELRAPLVSIVDGVAFVDIGNVFPRVKDFSFTDLRQSAGFGVRVRTPWFLLRGDYGIVLDPRPGERRGRFYFSIGQAF